MTTTFKMTYTPRPPATKSPDKSSFRKPVWPIAPDGFIPNSVVRSLLHSPKITRPATEEKQGVSWLRPKRPVLRRPTSVSVEEESCPENHHPYFDYTPSTELLKKLDVRVTRFPPPPAPKPVSKTAKKPVAPNKPFPDLNRFRLRNIKLGVYEKLEEHVRTRKAENTDRVVQDNTEAPYPAEEETSLPITAPEEEIPVEAVSEKKELLVVSAEPEREEDSTVPPKTVRRRLAVRAQRPQKLKLPPLVELQKERKSLPRRVVEKQVKVQMHVQEIQFPQVHHIRIQTQPEITLTRSFEPQPPKCHSRRLDSGLMHLYKRSKAAHLVARDAPATVSHFLHQCHLQKKHSPSLLDNTRT